MSTVTLPSGRTIDKSAPAAWDARTLDIMRYQAECLADLQRTRFKNANRLNRYVALNKFLAEPWLPDHMRGPRGQRLPNPNFLQMLAGYELERYDPKAKDKIKLAPLPAEKEIWKQLVQNLHFVATAAVIEWQESIPGIGAAELSRLIGLIGNPRVAAPMHMESGVPREDGEGFEFRDPVYDRYVVEPTDTDPGVPWTYERTLRQLWSYCGVGDPDRKRSQVPKGDQAALLACGRRRARAVLFNMANSIVRQKGKADKPGPGANSSYTYLYETTKQRYAVMLHSEPCIRCGTPGKPAQPGTGWKDGHKDASAKKIIAKQVLKDLWQRS